MNAAAAHLIGEHDFSAFRAAECQSKTPMRRVTALTVERAGDFVTIRVTANAFLHHMVRNIWVCCWPSAAAMPRPLLPPKCLPRAIAGAMPPLPRPRACTSPPSAIRASSACPRRFPL